MENEPIIRKEIVISASNANKEKEEDFNSFFDEINLMTENYNTHIVKSSFKGETKVLDENTKSTKEYIHFVFYIGIKLTIDKEVEETIIDFIISELREIRKKYRNSLVGVVVGDLYFI